jgi:hypothetical protein
LSIVVIIVIIFIVIIIVIIIIVVVVIIIIIVVIIIIIIITIYNSLGVNAFAAGGCPPTAATPILLEELSMQQLEDIWLKCAVRFWTSVARLPAHHLYATVAQGVLFSGC